MGRFEISLVDITSHPERQPEWSNRDTPATKLGSLEYINEFLAQPNYSTSYFALALYVSTVHRSIFSAH